MTGQKRIVVGVDGSDSSRAALRWAMQHAREAGARVEAVIAWRHPTTYDWQPTGIAGDFAGTAATARGLEHLEVDPPRHPRVEGRLLDHRAGLRHDPRVGKAPAKQKDLARRRRDQAQQHPDGRGLARAVRAEKTIDLT